MAHRKPQAEPETAPAVVRRQPLQQRSRERLDLILSCASRLIEAHGSGPLKMSEVADLAGISIGSLYQYFPDKRAIVCTLAEQFAVDCQRQITATLAAVTRPAELDAAFCNLVDQYHAMLLDKPVLRDIAFGMRADKALGAIQLAQNRASGALLAEAICRVHPEADGAKVQPLAFLIWQLGEEAMRLALDSADEEAALLVDAYKRMSLRAMAPPWVWHAGPGASPVPVKRAAARRRGT